MATEKQHLKPEFSHSYGHLVSPTDSVFLHMEGIPHTQERLSSSTEVNAQQVQKNEECGFRLEPETSSKEMEINISPCGPEEPLGRKLLRTLSGRRRKPSADSQKSADDNSNFTPLIT